MKIKIFSTLIFLLFSVTLISPVLAQDNTVSTMPTSNTDTETKRIEVREKIQDRVGNIRENTALRLEGVKLRSCQAREAAVKNRLSSLIRLTQNMENKFASISARVMEYYETKVLPDNSLANYQELVDDIAAKKVSVDDALASAQSSADSFSCESDDPKGLFRQFKDDMQAVKNALREYRFSIKNLIVAIRSLNSNGDSE